MTEIFGHLLLRLRQWLGGLRTASIHVTRPTMFGNSQSSMQPRRLPAIDRRLGIRLTVWCDVSISHGTLFFMWREVSIIRRTSISIAWSGRVTGCGSLTMTQHAIWCQVTCHLTSGDLTSQFSSNLRTVYIIQWIVFCASLWILLLQNTSRIKIKLQGRALELEPHHSVPSKTLGWLPWLSCVWGLPMNVAADEAPGILHE